MAIVFDAYTTNSGGTQTTLTFSHTCTGTDRGLIVAVFIQNASNLITGVTYNSVSMTLVDVQRTDTANEYGMLYYLANPASGANNVSITASSSSTFQSRVISYRGVHQTTMLDTSAKNSVASGTTLSTSPTTTVDDCWAVSYARNSSASLTNGTNFTTRASDSVVIGDSNGSVGVAGGKTVTANCGTSGIMAMVTAMIRPSLTSGPANLKSYNTNLTANIKSINTNPIANVKSLNTNV